MKIAMMTNNYKPFVGGVPISVERLKNGLEELGHEVVVFAPAYGKEAPEPDECRYSTLAERIFGGIVLPNPFDRKIEETFRKGDFDVIHVHHPVLIGRTAVYLSQKYHVPLVYTYHTRYEQYLSYLGVIRKLEESTDRHDIRGRLSRCLLRFIQEGVTKRYLGNFFRHCDLIFTPTKGMERYFQSQYRRLRIPTRVLPTGLERELFASRAEEAADIRKQVSAENIPLFVTVARMAHEKNIEFLLRAIARFRERFGQPFRVLMIGEGPEKESYMELAGKLELEEAVIFLGRVDNRDIPAYMQAADAFLFASKTETQGIVILEAFAGRSPVIAVRASGVEDLVMDGRNGYLTEENEEIFADAMLTFLQQSGDRRQAMEESALACAYEYRETEIACTALDSYGTIFEKGRAKCADTRTACLHDWPRISVFGERSEPVKPEVEEWTQSIGY